MSLHCIQAVSKSNIWGQRLKSGNSESENVACSCLRVFGSNPTPPLSVWWLSSCCYSLQVVTSDSPCCSLIHSILCYFRDIPGCLDVCQEIKKQIEDFRPHIPLIQALRNPGTRNRSVLCLASAPQSCGFLFFAPAWMEKRVLQYQLKIRKSVVRQNDSSLRHLRAKVA